MRERAGYTAVLSVLFAIAAGISYSLHALRHIDPVLTKWMFWLFVACLVAALGRLGLLLARL